MSESRIESPCVCVCLLDENDICTGCFRSGEEITNWFDRSEEEKLKILKNCSQRRKEMGYVL